MSLVSAAWVSIMATEWKVILFMKLGDTRIGKMKWSKKENRARKSLALISNIFFSKVGVGKVLTFHMLFHLSPTTH